jgi:hypothetical protein
VQTLGGRDQCHQNQVGRNCAATSPDARLASRAIRIAMRFRVNGARRRAGTFRVRVVGAIARHFRTVRAGALTCHQRRNAIGQMGTHHQQHQERKETSRPPGGAWQVLRWLAVIDHNRTLHQAQRLKSPTARQRVYLAQDPSGSDACGSRQREVKLPTIQLSRAPGES